jgi:hypothetical protein
MRLQPIQKRVAFLVAFQPIQPYFHCRRFPQRLRQQSAKFRSRGSGQHAAKPRDPFSKHTRHGEPPPIY